MKRISVLFAAALFVLSALPAHAETEDATFGLHLVLAIDVSASVNDQEFDLQRSGTADALRDPDVQAAIANLSGGLAVSVIQWSSVKRQAVGLEWHRLSSVADVERFAGTVDAMPRKLPGGGTMIHAGLAFASRMLERAPGIARRHVIDIAGNGETDDFAKMQVERDRLVSKGVVINGLAIEELPGNLTRYFRENVIGGLGSFVVTADDFEDFRRAIRIKLLREISGPSVARLSNQ